MSSFIRKNENLIIVFTSAILLIIGIILQHFLSVEKYVFLAYFAVVLLICGHKVIFKAISNIVKGNLLDENFLMSIASIGALIIGEYVEAVGVMLFYNIGEYFQKKAVNKSRNYIKKAVDIREKFANIVTEKGTEKINSKLLKVGDIIEVKAGEKIAVDGIICSGVSSLDMSVISGESMPVDVRIGDDVVSGSINLSGVIRVEVTKIESESTAAKIVELIEDASVNKSKSEQYITKFAKVYTPVVVLIALLVAIIPPIFDGNWSEWVYRSLSVLVVSCPCAIVISVPLAFFGAIGSASKQKILIKGGGYLEKFSQIDTVVFDKTGTVTKGEFVVENVQYNTDKSEFLRLIASIESYSTHPIACAITTKYANFIDKGLFLDVEEIAGFGLIGTVKNDKIIAGKYEFLVENGVKIDKIDATGSVIYLAKNNKCLGYIVVKDEVKSEAKNFVEYLNKTGKNTIMLTGDSRQVATEVAKNLGIENVKYNLMPQDKLDVVNDLINSGKKVCFIGDGINDAPVLKRADVSIAMGAKGADIAVDSSDIVLLNDKLDNVIWLDKLSKKTTNIVKQNVFIPLLVKIIVLILSTVGTCSMWLAIFADVGVMVLAILNSTRLLKVKNK